MKKLLFVLVFIFIGQQAFSQMYIVIVNSMSNTSHPSGCFPNTNSTNNKVMTTVSPSGGVYYTCLVDAANINSQAYATAISTLNQEFNSILGQGYTLIATSADADIIHIDGAWYFAVP